MIITKSNVRFDIMMPCLYTIWDNVEKHITFQVNDSIGFTEGGLEWGVFDICRDRIQEELDGINK